MATKLSTCLNYVRGWFKRIPSDKLPRFRKKSSRPVKLVMDTCAITAALFGSRSAQIVRAWKRGEVVFYYSTAIEKEYERILMRIPPVRKKAQTFLQTLRENHSSVRVDRVPRVNITIEDSEDVKFLACADVAEVDYLISLDKHLLDVEKYEGIPIVRPGKFLQEVEHRIPSQRTGH